MMMLGGGGFSVDWYSSDFFYREVIKANPS